VALLFGVVFALLASWDLGAQYFAGYLVEKSLSIDNLCVFVVMMSTLAVFAEQQARALTLGILAALALWAMFIARARHCWTRSRSCSWCSAWH
jgi:tellurite resistance protein TerC